MEKLVIYGAGLLGKQVYYHLKTYYSREAHVIGFVDDTKASGERIVDSLTNLGGFQSTNFQQNYSVDKIMVVFAIGYSDMKGRFQAYKSVVDKGYRLFSVLHPQALIERNSTVGEGSIVMAKAVVDQGVTIGPICYIDVGVIIGEYSQIGENNFLAASCVFGGSITIGNNNFFGLNSTVVNGVTLGDNLTINAQTLIHKNYDSDLQIIEMHKIRSSSPLILSNNE